MKSGLLYILSLMLITAPAYADEVNVAATKTQNLNFGKAVMLATSGTVGIRTTDGEPIWLRCMKSNTGSEPTVGRISFSSPMTDGYEVLVIKPTLASTEINLLGTGCTLNVKNLVLSANSANLTASVPTQSFNIGGTLEISGYCSANYEYSGAINVNYSVQKVDTTELKSGSVTLPITFQIENRADVTKDTDLNFGRLVADGTAGTVVLSTSGAISSISDGLHSRGGQTEGQISIFGTPDMQITGVSYPSSINICLDGDPSNSCMTVDTFTRLPAGLFRLDESRNSQGYKMLHIGGTLHVGANQPAGTYSGTLNITISY